MILSTDGGLTWTHVVPPYAAQGWMISLEFAGFVFVAGGGQGAGRGCTWVSADGRKWEVGSDGSALGVTYAGVLDIAWSGRSAVAVAPAGTDGKTAFQQTLVV